MDTLYAKGGTHPQPKQPNVMEGILSFSFIGCAGLGLGPQRRSFGGWRLDIIKAHELCGRGAGQGPASHGRRGEEQEARHDGEEGQN